MVSSKHKTFVITTTIRVPILLRDISKNAQDNGHPDVTFLVIGDIKTPPEAEKLCKDLAKDSGVAIEYLDVQAQEKAIAEFPSLSGMIPLNSAVRKMIGNFIAYRRGCDSLVMLDDDNFFNSGDFIGGHNVVSSQTQIDLIKSDTGWFSVAEAMIEESGVPFYPRGYPWSQRNPSAINVTRESTSAKVVINQGFVLEDPDVDAISRLFWPIRVSGMNKDFEPRFGLKPGTWCSFNNQNTALAREVIPAYFTPFKTGRNSDIWTSFVMCRLAEHLNGVIAFGDPQVRQVRNPHSLWQDLDDELLNNKATDAFVELLRSTELSQDTYGSALGELLEKCLATLPSLSDIPESEAEMMRDFFLEYQIWQSLFINLD
jgi:hypothetical protein